MRIPPRPYAPESGSSTSTGTTTLPLRLITFNVRYATQNPVANEKPWQTRCPRLCTQIRFATTGHDSAFLCVQEALHQQVLDIHSHLGSSEWAYIGQGRDDGKTAGEFSPVFYRKRFWHCEQSRMYWLSETPERPSRGWDAVLNRIITVGLFRHRATGQPVVVMSTHFDHIGVRARQESAKLILRIANVWRQGQAGPAMVPVFLGGDFNSTPDDGAYKTITAMPGGMADISDLVPPERRYGNPTFTYTSFDEPDQRPQRIDFLFVRDPDLIRVGTFAVLANRFDDGMFLSDHRAVVTDVEIPVRNTGGAY